MEDGSSLPLWGVLILLTLLGLNGIFYGFSAAVKNLSESEIQKQALDGNKKAILLKKLMEHPVQYVNAIPLIVTASGISIGAFLVPWITRFSRHYIDHASVFALVLFVCVLLLASFGILTFRRVGTYCPEKFAFRYVGMVNAIVSILYPLTLFITWIAKLTAVPFGVELNQKEDAVTEEEIISIVDEAHEQGVIEESEAEMIQNIIEFNETMARDVMTHRKNILALDGDMFLEDALKIMLDENYSRYPVYQGDIDNIIGIIHVKDAMKQMTYGQMGPIAICDIPRLIREVEFIPETRNIDSIFQYMRNKKDHMVIVIDEYGQTAGLIALEDILEEIVGNILDEYDDDESFIVHQFDDSILMDGLTPLKQVSEVLQTDFENEDYETLNGYLTFLLDHIPNESDEEVCDKGFSFQILKVEKHIIQKVRVERITEEEGEKKVCQDIQNSQT